MSGILVIYAGGTIGMKPGPAGLVSDPQFVARLQAALPDVAFAVFTCEPAIDSSSATPPPGSALPMRSQRGARITAGL